VTPAKVNINKTNSRQMAGQISSTGFNFFGLILAARDDWLRLRSGAFLTIIINLPISRWIYSILSVILFSLAPLAVKRIIRRSSLGVQSCFVYTAQ